MSQILFEKIIKNIVRLHEIYPGSTITARYYFIFTKPSAEVDI